jgi:ABC-2 type transport system permease protein
MALLLVSLAALGLACSAFASHPAIAAAVALVLTLGLWAVNMGAQLAGVDDGAINWLAMSSHLQPLLRGLVASPDLVWFALLAIVCLALATRRVAAERERG